MDRYKFIVFDGVVDCVVRVFNFEGAYLAYGIEFVKCVMFVKVVSGVVKEYVKVLDDVCLEVVFKVFEDDDDVFCGGDVNFKRFVGGAFSKKKWKFLLFKVK